MQGSYRTQLLWILLDRFRVQNVSIVLANFQVVVVMVGQLNLLVVISQLQIRHIFILLWRRLVGSTGLLPLLELLALFL